MSARRGIAKSSRSVRGSGRVEDTPMETSVPVEGMEGTETSTPARMPAPPSTATPAHIEIPTRTKSQVEKASELISSFVKDAKSRDVEVVFAFDTTGSMYGHLAEVRKKLHESISRLHRDVPNIRIGVIAVGDYCDQNSSYVVKPFDLSKDLNAIVQFVDKVMPSGGGDAPEAYELALRTVRSDFSWTAGPHNKALVMIGDAAPHAPSYTTERIWWRDQVLALSKMGVKIYGVQCGLDATARHFYEEMAASTGGVYLDLAKVSLITDMFLAVCYREFGPEALEAYRVEAEKNTAEPEGLRHMFAQLAAGATTTTTPGAKKCTADWYALENDKNTMARYTLRDGKWVTAGIGAAAPAVMAYATPAAHAVGVLPLPTVVVARGRKAAVKTSKASRRSASPRKAKPAKSPRRRAAAEESDDDDDEEEEVRASPAHALTRGASYAVGSGDWKRDRLGRMSRKL